MNAFSRARAVSAALAGLVVAGSIPLASPSQAGIKDYHFELVEKTVKVGPDVDIAVRLVEGRTGRAVPAAVIFATRLDMAPDAMADMTTKIALAPGAADGVYRFKAKVPMGGNWRLSLGAKVQGETGTVDDELVLKAGDQ